MQGRWPAALSQLGIATLQQIYENCHPASAKRFCSDSFVRFCLSWVRTVQTKTTTPALGTSHFPGELHSIPKMLHRSRDESLQGSTTGGDNCRLSSCGAPLSNLSIKTRSQILGAWARRGLHRETLRLLHGWIAGLLVKRCSALVKNVPSSWTRQPLQSAQALKCSRRREMNCGAD